eukprot:1994278-Prymnesium_polylepis.1
MRLWQPRSRQVASSGAGPWGATPRLCFHPDPPRREVGASLREWGAHICPGLARAVECGNERKTE